MIIQYSDPHGLGLVLSARDLGPKRLKTSAGPSTSQQNFACVMQK